MPYYRMIVDQLPEETVTEEFSGTLREYADKKLKEYCEANGYSPIIHVLDSETDPKDDAIETCGFRFEKLVDHLVANSKKLKKIS